MPRRHRSHSTEFKQQVVAEYHSGETLHSITLRVKIRGARPRARLPRRQDRNA